MSQGVGLAGRNEHRHDAESMRAASPGKKRVIAGHRRAVLLSFEGPDRYSSVGGLGTRETAFAHALADADVDTTLLFIGDPSLPPVETHGSFTLRRWSQWLSRFHPLDVYDGEAAKVDDFTASAPSFVVDEIIVPASARDERVLVVAEEWQTVGAVLRLDALARMRGVRDRVTLLWNANNTYGFERIAWAELGSAATIMTISKYMKFELARIGVPALVVPNGIPESLLDGPPPQAVSLLRHAFRGRPTLLKVGRFDPDKNWLQAVDAVRALIDRGLQPQLIVRGGREPYGETVYAHAASIGLRVEPVKAHGDDARSLSNALAESTADVVVLEAFLSEPMLHAAYAAADAVLANSGKEPFGLVGLEVMAVGGIPICGATGEEYAEPFVNAIVCDTSDGRELATYLAATYGDERRADRMRQAGYATASRYTWQNVLETLAQKIAYVSQVAP